MVVVKRLASFIETIHKYTYNDTLTMTVVCSLHSAQLRSMLSVSYIKHISSFEINNKGNEGNQIVQQSFVNTSDITLQSFLSII